MSITRHWILAIKIETLEDLKDKITDQHTIGIIDDSITELHEELRRLEWNESIEKELHNI